MKIATLSLRVGMTEQQCKEVASQARRKKIDFGGFTEVRDAHMLKGLREGLGASHTLRGGSHAESPQFFNHHKWELISSEIKDGVAGVAKVTPSLHFVVCTYRNKRKPSKVIEVVSTHFVPLSLHGKWRLDHTELRKEMWSSQWNKLKKIIETADIRGHTIFVIGDFNNIFAGKDKIKELSPHAKWLIRGGLDWVFFVEGTTKVTKLGVATYVWQDASDHKARARNVWLR